MKNLFIWAAVIIVVWFILPSWIFKLAIGAGILYFLYKIYLKTGGKPINFKFWKKNQPND